MAILGLMSAESFASNRLKSIRRSVFYFYPNGAAPLIGILSLLKDESINDPHFKVFEKRLSQQRTLTASIAANVALYKTVSSDFAAYTAADANLNLVADTNYGLKVVDTSVFRVGHIIKTFVYVGAALEEVIGRVVHVDTSNSRIAFTCVRGQTTVVYNSASAIGVEVLVVGSAYGEGTTDESSGIYNLPVDQYNFTQIFKTPFTISGTALKTAADFDETGTYRDMSKENSIYHMIEMEKSFVFGERRKVDSGPQGQPIRYTGGILWYLRQFEMAASIYRGPSSTAATANTDDDKRIINVNGSITLKVMNGYYERAFRVTNNKTNEKLAICGSGFLNVVQELYRSAVTLNSNLPFSDTYGMDVIKHVTTFGTIYYKSHPLFSQNPILRYNCLIVDVQNLKYKYMDGRDTELLKNRQANDADYRKDEWLTEAGLEALFPDSCMYLQNVLDNA
jgi:hypothetical protein